MDRNRISNKEIIRVSSLFLLPMMRIVAVIKKMLSFFLPRNEVTATYITVCWEAEEHKIKIKDLYEYSKKIKN